MLPSGDVVVIVPRKQSAHQELGKLENAGELYEQNLPPLGISALDEEVSSVLCAHCENHAHVRNTVTQAVVSFHDDEAFRLQFLRELLLVSWVEGILDVQRPQGSVERKLLVQVVTHVVADVLLAAQVLVLGIWLVERLRDGFFLAHLLVVVVAKNFFNFVAQFGMFIH